ncbi:MAG: hypothetical protein COB50_02340 [Thiotrichales bacterium]|nr:MAG: hypothetical protein COB50_02340 [Thiotrichales bacterium]
MHYTLKFPKKFAINAAFCNRDKLRKSIIESVKTAQHILIIAPRRYGKSSLGLISLQEAKIPFERIDLFMAIDEHSINTAIANGIKTLISKVATPSTLIIKKLSAYIRSLRVNWSIGINGVSLQLHENQTDDVINNIRNLLLFLEETLKIHKQKAVLFIDEFQEIGKLGISKSIEAVIRNVAEGTEYLSFIFSGSHRHLLSMMFDDDNRPLYNLCDRINLQRIAAKHYVKFIGDYAKQTWKQDLSKEVYDKIFLLTERHPNHMNALCRQIWSQYHTKKNPPKADVIDALWDDYVDQTLDQTADKLNKVNLSQKKVLISIANGITTLLTSKHILAQLNLSSGAITKAVNILLKEDFIEYKNNELRIINPVHTAALRKFYSGYVTR